MFKEVWDLLEVLAHDVKAIMGTQPVISSNIQNQSGYYWISIDHRTSCTARTSTIGLIILIIITFWSINQFIALSAAQQMSVMITGDLFIAL